MFNSEGRAVWECVLHLCIVKVLNLEEERVKDPGVIGIDERADGMFLLAAGSWLQRISRHLDGDGSLKWKWVWDLINGECVQDISDF
jgi:hypothetical protein